MDVGLVGLKTAPKIKPAGTSRIDVDNARVRQVDGRSSRKR